MYLSSAAGRKVKRLIGFNKVELAPGEEKRVTVAVDSRLLADFDVARQRWRVAPGKYHIVVGGSSMEVKLEGDTAVRAAWVKP